MHLKMKTSISGAHYAIANGADVPVDENFPFSVNEVHRLCAAELAEFVGTDAEIAAWLKANPYVDDRTPAVETAAADAAKAEADAAKGAATPAAPAETKPAAAKSAAKKA